MAVPVCYTVFTCTYALRLTTFFVYLEVGDAETRVARDPNLEPI